MPRKSNANQTLSIGPTMKTEPRCNICMSGARTKVDRLLAAQFGYKAVAEELVSTAVEFQNKNLDTVRKNVERHAKAHLDIRSKAVREIVERRAKEQGVLIDTVEGQITSGRALLDLIVGRGTEQIASNPQERIRYADAIEAVKMLETVQKEEYVAELERMQRQVYAISAAVQEIVPANLLPTLVKRAEDIFENGDTKIALAAG
jgi:hypothetical protein